MKKKTVILICGGASSEHEVSIRSSAYFIENIDRQKYNLVVIGISKSCEWFVQSLDLLQQSLQKSKSKIPAISFEHSVPYFDIRAAVELSNKVNAQNCDLTQVVALPLIHGATGEDGKLQGLLDMQGVAYAGADVASSAVCIDKAYTKVLCENAGVSVVPYVCVYENQWLKNSKQYTKEINETLQYPLFIKPARLGSSVGIVKVSKKDELQDALLKAFDFDTKVLVESGMNVREIEFAVMGSEIPNISDAGEVITNSDVFYDYEAKYVSEDAAKVEIPASLSKEQKDQALLIVQKTWQALDLYGFARVDLFLCKDTNQLYLNEVNTIPGFTSISQFPLLWKNAGMSPKQIIDSLIELALKRKAPESK